MEITTDRLLLRPLTPDDAESLYELDRDAEVLRFIGRHALDSAAAYRDRLADWTDRRDGRDAERLFLALRLAADSTWVGWLHLRPALDFRFAAEAGYRDGEHDLGYRLARAAWGRGLATEAATAVLAFARRLGWRRVVTSALIGNAASIRVMEKLGLVREHYFQLPGYDQVSVRYGTPAGRAGRGGGGESAGGSRFRADGILGGTPL